MLMGMTDLHPALTIRADLAAITPQTYQVIAPTSPLREIHGQVGSNDSEIYFGELFDVYEINDGVAYGQNKADRYTGYVAVEALSKNIHQPTHRVDSLGAFIYPVAGMKSVPLLRVSIGSYVTVTGGDENGYLPIAWGDRPGFMAMQNLRGIDDLQPDFVATAKKLIGVPYLWGGRTSDGIDCSGLVQLVLSFAGKQVDRDTAVQSENLPGERIGGNYERGDILFSPGHVVIMYDAETILHANAGSMSVRLEKFDDFLARARTQITSAVRLRF